MIPNSRAPRARTLCSLAASSVFATALATATPAAAGPELVVDAASGAVLISEEAGRAWHPASTTKMMTLYVALRALKSGRIGLETAIPASKLAASQRPVKVHIKPGQEITLDNAMKIMMVKSANDIAYVIAEGVGGNVESFVAMMNAEARRLGMSSSRFVNPNGWHHPDQQTSARDLAVLAMALMREFPEYAGYWSIGAVQLGRTTLNNTNGLMGRYAGATGFKTGFVCASGFNLVATANHGGRMLIAVVLGAMSGAERTIRASQLLDEGFAKWGGSGYNVASISGDGGRAYSICDELKRRGKGVVFSDDADFQGPISFGSSTVLAGGNTESGREPMSGPAQRGSALVRSVSGRATLGPRANFAPVQVSFGRTAGSASAPVAANVAGRAPTAVAAVPEPATAPGTRPRTISPTGAIPASATAFAPTRPLPAKPQVVEEDEAPRGAPLSLQGAIRPGTASVAPSRPAGAAGIRPPASPLTPAATGQKPGAVELAARNAAAARPATAALAPARPLPGTSAGKPEAGKPPAGKPVAALSGGPAKISTPGKASTSAKLTAPAKTAPAKTAASAGKPGTEARVTPPARAATAPKPKPAQRPASTVVQEE